MEESDLFSLWFVCLVVCFSSEKIKPIKNSIQKKKEKKKISLILDSFLLVKDLYTIEFVI